MNDDEPTRLEFIGQTVMPSGDVAQVLWDGKWFRYDIIQRHDREAWVPPSSDGGVA